MSSWAFKKASITSLPFARVKSPDWLAIICIFGKSASLFTKPVCLSVAAEAPTVPCSSTILPDSLSSLAISIAAFSPSSIKSEPINVAYKSLDTSAVRSTNTIGIPASLASWNTVSQPVSTTGANPITSTPCWMKERIAAIWFSCLCWASENFKSMPRSLAVSNMDCVSASRHPLSWPICAKPTTSAPPPGLGAVGVSPAGACAGAGSPAGACAGAAGCEQAAMPNIMPHDSTAIRELTNFFILNLLVKINPLYS